LAGFKSHSQTFIFSNRLSLMLLLLFHHGEASINVTQPLQEPLLNVADYFCRAVQNVFEKGETRFYNFLQTTVYGPDILLLQ